MPDADPELIVTIIEAKGTADELERLVRLLNEGILTPAEFAAAKQRVRLVLTQTLIPTPTRALTPPVI